MGAINFCDEWPSTDTTEVAFTKAVAESAYINGHGGYSGTLAEKHDFREIHMPRTTTPTMGEALAWIDTFGCDYDTLGVNDKWGPAGVIRTTTGYVFFGWASY
jgi:hypothetical protein